MTSSPQRDYGGAFTDADQGRDVVAHAREGIAAAVPSFSGHAPGIETAALEREQVLAVTR